MKNELKGIVVSIAGRDVTLTIEEARALHQALVGVFGAPPPMWPTPPTTPVDPWPYRVWSSDRTTAKDPHCPGGAP